MRKTFVLLVMLTLVVMPMAAFAQTDGAAVIRFVHVVNGAPTVDVYVDGAIRYSALDFGQATPYLPIAAGSHQVTVTSTGNTAALWEQSLDAAADQALVAVASTAGSFTIFTDDLNPLPVGRARLTAIHAIPDAGAVDVVLADGRPVIPNLAYSQPYGTLDVPVNTYELLVLPAGGALDGALIPPTPFGLATGTSYIILAYGTSANPAVLLLSAPTLPNADGSARVRVVHAADGLAEVDVNANGTLLIPSLGYDAATEYVALPAGEYEITLTEPGDTTAIVTATVEVAGDMRYVVVASAAGGAPVISAFSTGAAAITADEAVLSLINVAPNITASAAYGSAGSVQDTEVAGQESTSVVVMPTTQEITVSTDSPAATNGFGTGMFGSVLYDAVVSPGENTPVISALQPVSIPLTAGVPTIVIPAIASDPAEAFVTSTSQQQQPQVLPTADPNVAVATPTNSQPQPQILPPVQPTPAVPTARVILNPGANLHLRQYPSAEAFSLGLAPAGTVFRVLGREGAPEAPTFFTPTPTPVGAPTPTPFIDPAVGLGEDEDLVPFETWLFVEFDTPDGGVITAWVNAQYLEIRDARGRLQKLKELPLIPRNRAGQQGGIAPGIAPTQNPFRNVNVATVQGLEPGANLHLRRFDSAQSESLTLIPNGTAMIILGRNDVGDWLQVDYQGTIGWVAVPYVRVSYNEDTIDVLTIPVIGESDSSGTPRPPGAPNVGVSGPPTDAPGDESGD